MGNQNCKDIKLEPNRICDIGHCTTEVEGIPSNSASLSDVWFLSLKDGTKYGDIKIKDDVVLKIYMNPGNIVLGGLLVGSFDMLYESQVYEHVVGPMLKYRINPHFVTFYGNARQCTFDNMMDILRDKTVDMNTGEIMPDSLLAKLLIRNTFWYGNSNPDPNRPSINDPFINNDPNLLDTLQVIYKNRNKIEYNLIATASSSGVMFEEWIQQNIKNGKMNYVAQVTVINVISALVALEQFECAHNDLHFHNIFVDEYVDSQVTNTYIYYDVIEQKEIAYQTTSNVSPAIYDWDKSYVHRIGPNPGLARKNNFFCEAAMHCNEYVPSRDILKFIVGIASFLNKEKIADLLKVLFRHPKSMAYFELFVLNGPDPFFLVDSKTGKTLSADWIKQNVREPSRILSRLIQLWINNPLIKVINIDENIKKLRPYNCSKNIFPHVLCNTSTDIPCNVHSDCGEKGNCIDGKCCEDGYKTVEQREREGERE